MATTITINGFHPGAGASTIAANVATLLAQQGQRVAVVDAAFSTPTQQILFRLDEDAIQFTLNDYLLGRCALHQVVVQPDIAGLADQIWVVPASASLATVGRALREAYDFDLLGESYAQLSNELDLNTVIVDAEVGQHPSTLASLASSRAVLAVVQLDLQQYHAIGITVELADQMGIPRRVMAANLVPDLYDPDEVRRALRTTYGWDVVGLLPYCDELMALGSGDIFVLRYPNHPMVATFQRIADALTI